MASKYTESTNPGSTNFGFDLDKFQNIWASLSSFESENYNMFYPKELFLRIIWETMDIRNQEKKEKKNQEYSYTLGTLHVLSYLNKIHTDSYRSTHLL